MSTATKTIADNIRNGARRPTRGGITEQMWLVYDSAPTVITPAEVRALAEQMGWNTQLAQSHYRQWKTWTGSKSTTSAKKTAKDARRA